MDPQPSDRAARSEPVEGELYGPADVGPMLGVKPQVVVNWIREDRIHASAVDELGRNRFTAEDVHRIRASLHKRTKA
jgi:predicted site-specific integrase-resolvase